MEGGVKGPKIEVSKPGPVSSIRRPAVMNRIMGIKPKFPPGVSRIKIGKESSAGPVPVVPVSNVGNIQRTAVVRALLRMFAKSDFAHDFGERDVGRDLITRADKKRFLEMIQRLPVKNRVAYENKFDTLVGSGSVNLYELFANTIANALYPGGEVATAAAAKAEFKHEPEVMRDVGIEFEDELKSEIRSHFGLPAATVPETPPYSQAFKFGPNPDAYPDASRTRNYIVRAQRYKYQDGQTRNLSSLFSDVTGANKFALLVDAASGLSLTSIRNATLPFPPDRTPEECSFAILQNIESDADSATGVSDFRETGTGGPNFEVLRDVGTSTVVFPAFPMPSAGASDADNSQTEAENLFTQISIILNRVEKGEIEASILIGNETHTIPDVGTASNVKNASLNALAAKFAAEILGAAAQLGDRRKPYIYALLKRMGDWCQALSLLDRTRVYTAVDPKTGVPLAGASARQTTLQELIADGYEIGVVTNDRILLAYATFLGLNVYYTTASDLGCLVYFKNEDDLPSIASVQTRTQTLYEEFGARFGGTGPDSIQGLTQRATTSLAAPAMATIEAAVTTRLTPSFTAQGVNAALIPGVVKAFTSKVILSNLGELRTNFGELTNQINADMAEYSSIPDESTDPNEVKRKYTAITRLTSLAVKLKTDVVYNESVRSRLNAGTYAGTTGATNSSSEEAIFVELAKKMSPGGRITTSEAMARAKSVLLSEVDDIKQIQQKSLPGISITTYIPSITAVTPGTGTARPAGRDMENFGTLYEAFDTVRARASPTLTSMSGGGQRGGALRSNLLRFITQRLVYPYENDKSLERTIQTLISTRDSAPTFALRSKAKSDLEILENLPAAKLYSYVRDEKNHPYSVADKFLITKEDLRVLELLMTDIYSTPPPSQTSPAITPLEWNHTKFVIFRYMLLYHDILYARFERLQDESGPETIGPGAWSSSMPATGLVSAQIQASQRQAEAQRILHTEPTENYYSNIQSLALEAGLLRLLANMLSALPNGQLNAAQRANLNTLVRQVVDVRQSGYVDPVVLGEYITSDFSAADVAIIRRLAAGPLGPARVEGEPVVEDDDDTPLARFTSSVATTLELARNSILSKYSTIATFDEQVEVGAAVSTPSTAVQSLFVLDPEADALMGGGLQSSNETPSNVPGSSSSVLPGGRRGLYARLRQRAGEGTSSEL